MGLRRFCWVLPVAVVVAVLRGGGGGGTLRGGGGGGTLVPAMRLRVDPGDRFWLALLLIMLFELLLLLTLLLLLLLALSVLPCGGDGRGFGVKIPEKLLSAMNVPFLSGRGGGGGGGRIRCDDDMATEWFYRERRLLYPCTIYN